eukprot:4070657-Pyramimonas_sp.AAC.1
MAWIIIAKQSTAQRSTSTADISIAQAYHSDASAQRRRGMVQHWHVTAPPCYRTAQIRRDRHCVA